MAQRGGIDEALLAAVEQTRAKLRRAASLVDERRFALATEAGGEEVDPTGPQREDR